MAYGYDQLRLIGYTVKSILACQIEAQMGEHTHLKLRAILDETQKEQPVQLTKAHQKVEVYIQEQDKKISLFQGLVTKVQIQVAANVYWLEIEAKSSTYLLDIEKHSRSFQDIAMTYHQVIRQIVSCYPDADCHINIPEIPIGELLVQYEETDWQFIKRLVSRFNEGLFPAVEHPGIRFYAGVAALTTETINIEKMHFKKDFDGYYHINANTTQMINEEAFTIYEVETSGIYYLMHHVLLKGQKYYIKRLIQKLEEGLLVNHYELQLREGLTQPALYPMHLVGVAIGGKILAPKADKVRVHLEIDKVQDEQTAYWFPYSTMSASNDGSGWYCMPEVGDAVCVYFPTKYTKDAVALSSVYQYDQPTGGIDRMENPDVKYLGTIHDKEMKLAPEGIRIACNGHMAILTVGKDGHLSLYGEKSIQVNAEENVVITAQKDIHMTAEESVKLSCDKGGSFTLDEAGNIIMLGTEVKVD